MKGAILSIFLLVFYSCRTIKPEQPLYQDVKRTFVPASSVVNIPIEIPLQLVADRINKQFSGLLYDDDSFTRPSNDDLKLKVYMNKKIGLEARGNELKFTIPLSIYATGRWSACAICPELQRQTAFDIDVFLRSGIRIGKDYAFRLNTSADGFEWTSPPVVNVGPLRIPIGSLLEGVLNEQLKQIAAEIDKNVNGQVNLKAGLQSLWDMTAEPFLLDDSTETWLSVKPQKLMLSPIDGNNKRIRLNIGISALVQTFTGSRPQTLPPGKMPDLILGVPADDSFNLNIHSGISFDKTTRLAAAALRGYEFSKGRKKVKVEDVFVFGKGERAYIRLLLSGSLRGEIFLTGIPKFDSTTEELYFEALSFDLNTRNAMLGSAAWLLNGMIEQKLQRQLRFSFKPELNQIRADLSNKIGNFSYSDLLTIKGTLNNFMLRDIFVQDDGFALVFDATGKAAIYLNRLDF